MRGVALRILHKSSTDNLRHPWRTVQKGENMRSALRIAFCVVILTALTVMASAQNNATTLTGKITCAKCELKVEKECTTVIVVNENGKDAIYYLDAKSSKANHDAICEAGKPGSVTGVVSEKDGKKTITATKVEFKK
jgi:hypothetical protein